MEIISENTQHPPNPQNYYPELIPWLCTGEQSLE